MRRVERISGRELEGAQALDGACHPVAIGAAMRRGPRGDVGGPGHVPSTVRVYLLKELVGGSDRVADRSIPHNPKSDEKNRHRLRTVLITFKEGQLESG